MSGLTNLILFVVIVLDLSIMVTSRVGHCVRTIAIQGALLALLPLAMLSPENAPPLLHVAFMSVGSLVVKGIVIPWLLYRAIRVADVYREVEPFVSMHASLLIGAVLVLASFWIATVLVLPYPLPTRYLVPAAFSTLLIGFLVLVTRKTAITQVVGYVMLENGVYIFGQALAQALPIVVELGILLDVLGGIFVMGIAIHNISREFDHIDTERLASLKD
jgi:hydrogenase-4 component E